MADTRTSLNEFESLGAQRKTKDFASGGQGAALRPQGTCPLTLFCFAFFECKTGTQRQPPVLVGKKLRPVP
jgi:hypothetical protein